MALVTYNADVQGATLTGSSTLAFGTSWIAQAWDGVTPVPNESPEGTATETNSLPALSIIDLSPVTFTAPTGHVGTVTNAVAKVVYSATSTNGTNLGINVEANNDDPTDPNSSGTKTITISGFPGTIDTTADPTYSTFISYSIDNGGNPNGTQFLVISSVTIEVTYTPDAVWWFNSSTNQYEFAGTSPGAGWEEVPGGSEPVPHIESISASQGPIAGGTELTIVGTGFGTDATVSIGGVAATSVVVHDQTMITLLTGAYGGAVAGPVDILLGADDPDHAGETVRGDIDLVDVTVTNADAEFDTETDGFKYYDLLLIFWTIPGIGAIGPSIYPPTSPAGFPSPSPAADPDDKGWWLSLDDNFAGAAYIVSDSVPRNPRSFIEIASFATSSTGMMGGFPGPCGVWKNHIVYAKGGYTVGTDYPPIHLFDGSFDREIAALPAASGAVPKAVMSILVQGGTIYVSTLDSGTSSADFRGRVFSLSIETGVLSQIGTTFPAGHVPYAMAWHLGRLWVGTHRQSSAAAGKIYFIRPGIDTDWTDDYTLSSSSVAGCTSLLSYKGLLYVGTTAAAGTFAKVLVRGTDDLYTTSLTGSGGSAAANNGFLALTEFGGNLYASFWNPDTPLISTIRKFDNSSWTSVYTGSGGTLVPFVGFPQDEDVLFAIGGGLTYDGALVSTPDGTSWSDRTVFLTQTTPEATGLPAFGIIVK